MALLLFYYVSFVLLRDYDLFLITLMNCNAFIAWNPISHSNHLEALLGLCGCL
jgi:hypothetical protein